MSSKWNQLFEIAQEQQGYFATKQATSLGLASASLYQKVKSEELMSIQHGIYRFVKYPISENEDLMVVWLWSKKEGVFSHDTALSRYQISDVFPSKIHITLPKMHSKNRKPPPNAIVYFDDIPKKDRTWFGELPYTTPKRTINDFAKGYGDPNIIEQAVTNGIKQGLITLDSVLCALAYLVKVRTTYLES